MNRLGATLSWNGTCHFEVWAPRAHTMELRLLSPTDRCLEMQRDEKGNFAVDADGVKPGTQYFYRIDGEKERPDPASRCQPEGVHGPSMVVSAEFDWHDEDWKGIPWKDTILYELHVGTFSPEGTFDGAISRLDHLLDLGVTAVELMPLAQFSGERNWGYDGVFPYATQWSYGDSDGLKRFADACHQKGLAVVLDVVYNHLGPEGNYLWDYGYYFTDRYKTPWGPALNFDGPDSDEVRRFFLENALYWLDDFHIDALRLDAVHAIYDFSARPFLQELSQAVDEFSRKQGRPLYLIAESDLNDTRMLRPRETGGLGMTAQWCDDFHHAVHALLTGETTGYYEDFGRPDDLCKALQEGYVYCGQYSGHRRRRHGSDPAGFPAEQFVVFIQNHDQIGNRMFGDRLSCLVSPEGLKLAAATYLLSPYIPMLFMGEEYGEDCPFPYFIHHQDEQLVEAVRKGRKEEFSAFAWQGEPPDPQSDETFESGKVRLEKKQAGHHQVLYDFYKILIRLRKSLPHIFSVSKDRLHVDCVPGRSLLVMRRGVAPRDAFVLLHYHRETQSVRLPLPPGTWNKILDSAEKAWGGPGSRLDPSLTIQGETEFELPPHSVVVYARA